MHISLKVNFRHPFLLIFILAFFINVLPVSAVSGKDWFICAYGGKLGDNILTKVVFDPNFTDSKLTAFGFGRKMPLVAKY